MLTIDAGNRNTVLGRQLPHRFNVMAWFRVTDIWFEMMGDKKGLKCRLQKLKLGDKSWWAALDSPDPVPPNQRNFGIKPDSIECRSCHQMSPRIYDQGWMCLEPACNVFWKLTDDGSTPNSLSFHSTFLSYRVDHTTNPVPRYPLNPKWDRVAGALARISVREAWRAIICPNCSKCIPRTYWRGWKCSESSGGCDSCNFQAMVLLDSVEINDVARVSLRRNIRSKEGLMAPVINNTFAAPYRQLTYTLPGIGSITHFVANKAISSRRNGPDYLFQKFQETDLGLKRFPLKQSPGK